MASLAIVAILAGLAAPSITRSQGGAGAAGFAGAVDAQLTLARARAAATRRQQKLVVTADGLFHVEAATTGLGAPAAWRDVQVVTTPRDVEIAALAASALVAPGADIPPHGAGLGDALTFSPDGSSSAGTILLSSVDGREQFRVVLYRTGSSRVLREW